jgi:hypothetical protein
MVAGQFRKYAGKLKKWKAPRAASAFEILAGLQVTGMFALGHSRPGLYALPTGHVRFAPKATELLLCSEMSRCANTRHSIAVRQTKTPALSTPAVTHQQALLMVVSIF